MNGNFSSFLLFNMINKKNFTFQKQICFNKNFFSQTDIFLQSRNKWLTINIKTHCTLLYIHVNAGGKRGHAYQTGRKSGVCTAEMRSMHVITNMEIRWKYSTWKVVVHAFNTILHLFPLYNSSNIRIYIQSSHSSIPNSFRQSIKVRRCTLFSVQYICNWMSTPLNW